MPGSVSVCLCWIVSFLCALNRRLDHHFREPRCFIITSCREDSRQQAANPLLVLDFLFDLSDHDRIMTLLQFWSIPGEGRVHWQTNRPKGHKPV